jgi:hypothetical protein
MGDRDIPDLRIVLTTSLVLHEDADPKRVARLVERLREEGRLKNPPIVAPVNEMESFVVLDGANRASALRILGIRDALVQVVDYNDPAVELDTWYHLLSGIDKYQLFEAIAAIPGIRLRQTDLTTARVLWAQHKILAYIVCRDMEVHVIEGLPDLRQSAALLLQLTNTYRGLANIYRVKTDDLRQLRPLYSDIAAVIIFPPFTPGDILTLATNGAKLPTGITRHIIPKRALRVNIDLDFLAADRPLEDKNAWLQDWIRRKLMSKEIRFYQESTFLFDE